MEAFSAESSVHTSQHLKIYKEEYKEKELREYWANINEPSSPSGRYAGLYKALVIAVTDP